MVANDTVKCLNCGGLITESQPKDGMQLICPHCGNAHRIQLSWTLVNAGWTAPI